MTSTALGVARRARCGSVAGGALTDWLRLALACSVPLAHCSRASQSHQVPSPRVSRASVIEI